MYFLAYCDTIYFQHISICFVHCSNSVAKSISQHIVTQFASPSAIVNPQGGSLPELSKSGPHNHIEEWVFPQSNWGMNICTIKLRNEYFLLYFHHLGSLVTRVVHTRHLYWVMNICTTIILRKDYLHHRQFRYEYRMVCRKIVFNFPFLVITFFLCLCWEAPWQ